MLNDEVIDKVVERLVRRIEQGNEYVLQKIGNNIRKIGTLSPSKAQDIVQLLRYGGDYDKIVKKLAEITELNVKDIYKIFDSIAKSDYEYAKQFYEFRNKKYIPYNENIALKDQVRALAEITAREYVNISRTTAFRLRKKGKTYYSDIGQTYQNLIDEAILNVSQGKESFDSAMTRTIKQLGQSGVRTVDYASGRSRRLDSAVRMNIKRGITELHDELQKQLGKEFDSDGIEISVHNNPALDHEDAQGRQFSNEEFQKLQTLGVAKTYDKKTVNLHLYRQRSYSMSLSFRPIGEYNCYHYTFAIILGVSEPNYSDKELKEIKRKNHEGFDLFGKHYTMYDGTQLQRQLETKIREQKDIQILAVASDNKDLILESQRNIADLTQEYRYLCKKSGLPEYTERMKVSSYKRIAEGKLQ